MPASNNHDLRSGLRPAILLGPRLAFTALSTS